MSVRRLSTVIAVSLFGALMLALAPGASANGGSCDTPYTEVLQRQTSGVAVEQYRVIDNIDDWCEFWGQVHSVLFPAPECPVDLIDFDSELVLVAALGSRPNGCYSVDISCINELGQGDDLHVTVTEAVPGQGCVCTQAIVNPVDAVAVDRPVGRVDFFKKTARLDCR